MPMQSVDKRYVLPLLVVLAYGLGWGKKLSAVQLEYFSPAQFGPWFPFMSVKLLQAADKMASVLSADFGYTFMVSRVGEDRDGSTSQHNVLQWGEVRALDVTVLLNGRELTKPELSTLYSRIRALRLFSGIGVYPNWNTPGVHVDVREDRTVQNPATWGDAGVGVAHNYVAVETALA